MVRLILLGLLLFATLGVSISKAFLMPFGLDTNYLYIALGGIALSCMLAFRKAGMIFFVSLLVVAVNLPSEILTEYGIDRDLLLIVLLLVVAYPFINKAVTD